MKKHIFCLVLIAGHFSLTACSVRVSPLGPSGNYDYYLSDSEFGWGCSTGSVQADSLYDYCTNLLDDELNNYCAHRQRMQKFRFENCQQVIGIVGM